MRPPKSQHLHSMDHFVFKKIKWKRLKMGDWWVCQNQREAALLGGGCVPQGRWEGLCPLAKAPSSWWESQSPSPQEKG